jgi:outer membrane receptor protein involved in Fe transport
MPYTRELTGKAQLTALTILLLGAGTIVRAQQDNGAPSAGLEEIVVSAQKYKSTIQDTPISMSAVSGEQLAAQGITSVEDVMHQIPSISMRSSGPGQTEYEARGLASNGGAAPTVGFYLDEVPLSPPALAQVGKVVIDPDLYDINRIEVLRGPQGTLYGSGSMGGTVKVITNLPKLNTWEGSVQSDISGTQGGGLNGRGNFMVNAPIGDMFALRVVGTDAERSGWIDRVVLNPFPQDVGLSRGNILAAPVQQVIKDVNTEHLYGGRASLLFQPSEDFSAVLTVLYQRMKMGGYDEFDSPPGGQYLAHYQVANIPEPIDDTVHIYSLTVTANLGIADFTSATAYWNRDVSQTQDASESIGFVNGLYPYPPITQSETDESKQFSQEFRLASRDGDGRLRWVGGVFLSNLDSVYLPTNNGNVAYAQPGNPLGLVAVADNPYRIVQTALFGDGSFKITDLWKLSAGLRYYRYQSRQFEQQWGYDTPTPAPQTPTRTDASNSGFNPRINLSYSPSSDLDAYISASKGFRPGGANQYVPPSNQPPFCPSGATTSFGSDSVWNYEIGEKARFLDRRLTVNADVYYIRWSGIQQALLLSCGYQYQANAGVGRSFGPELEINFKLTDNWLMSASGSYTDAKVTQPNAQFLSFLTGAALTPNGTPYCASTQGCTAPILNVPKESANLALVYTQALFKDYQFTARVSDSFTGSSYDEAFFYAIRLPSYSIANGRVGISNEHVSGYFYVDNLTNKVAELTANNTSFQFNIPGLIRYSTNQPRTFGTQISYKF